MAFFDSELAKKGLFCR